MREQTQNSLIYRTQKNVHDQKQSYYVIKNSMQKKKLIDKYKIY